MFEATFKITALLESNGQGQRVFKVMKHEAPVDDEGQARTRACLFPPPTSASATTLVQAPSQFMPAR